MARTITDKLVATVVEFTDLGGLFPLSTFKGRIGLDVRVERGALRPGTRVRLCTPDVEEEIEIVGIEMLPNPLVPDVIRIVCSKPRMVPLPNGKAERWTITDA